MKLCVKFRGAGTDDSGEGRRERRGGGWCKQGARRAEHEEFFPRTVPFALK